MSNILGHLSALIQPTNTNHGGDERGILQEWSKWHVLSLALPTVLTRLLVPSRPPIQVEIKPSRYDTLITDAPVDHNGDEIDTIWQSALDIYASPHASTSQSSDSVVTRLLAYAVSGAQNTSLIPS